ncbi:MAG: oligosaccharide flippase family protein, partial [Candidatus Nitrosopolaris sp.]
MSKLEVGRGAAYLYAETITTMFGGYIFWLVISKLASTEIIGTYATIVSLANIVVTVVTFGIPNGIQSFLGKSFAEQKVENSKVWIKVSLVIVTVGLMISIIITVILRDLIYEAFKFDLNLLIVLILFMSSTSIYTLFRFVIIATLKTKRLTIVTVISTIIKFAVAVLLAFFGAASFGVAAGVILFPLLLSILLGLIITTILKSSAGKPNFTFGNALKKTFAASVGFWIPSVISIVGSQLGTIIVKGSQG